MLTQISFLSILVCSSFLFCISSNKLDSISCDICISFKSRHLETLLLKRQYHSAILHRYVSRVMVKRSNLQLYRTTILLAQLWMAASNHLINKCNQKIRQVKNQIIKHQIRRKIKATRLAKFLSCFFKLLESVLQHHFKIFSGTT